MCLSAARGLTIASLVRSKGGGEAWTEPAAGTSSRYQYFKSYLEYKYWTLPISASRLLQLSFFKKTQDYGTAPCL